MRSPAALRKIADPMRRAAAAADTVREIEVQAEETRARRDVATCIAHLDHDVAPVLLYRDVLDVSRGLFNRMIQRAPSDEDRAQMIREHPELFDAAHAVKTAKRAAVEVRKIDAKLIEVRDIRDETARGLMEGEFDGVRPISNADLARLCKITTARAAQIRYGETGASRPVAVG